MQKIIGLDIGSYSIKAVEIVNTFQTYSVTGFYENVIPDIEGIDQSLLGMTAVRQLFSDNELEADRIFTAMIGLLVSMRVLHLQNVKKRNIPTIVLNELEERAPFPLEEGVVDQQILDTKDGDSTVLAVLSRKDHVEAYLNGLKELNIEPKVIDVDYLAFMNMYPFLDFGDPAFVAASPKDKKPVHGKGKAHLLIDIGHLKTSLVLFRDGKLVTARTIRMGGRYFTDYLQKNLNISSNEAQRLKHKVSRLEYKSDARAKAGHEEEFNVAHKLALAVSELLRELVRTIYSFRSLEKVNIDAVLLTGGSSVIQNLPEYLEEFLEIPVRRMKFDNSRLQIEDPKLLNVPTMAQALAIGLRGVSGKEQSKINLRRGELAFVGSYDSIVRRVMNVSGLVAVIMICMMASYFLALWGYGSKINDFKKEFRNQVVQVLGSEPRNLKNMGPNPDLAIYSRQALKTVNDETRSREAILTDLNSSTRVTPLQVLNAISNAIPKDIPIEVTNFSVQSNAVVIEGETKDFALSDKILELLKQVPLLQAVERKSQENKPGSEGVIKFTISAAVKEGI